MTTKPNNNLIEHLRRAILLQDDTGVGDGELLGSFIERHDEAAFTTLVQRHGPMVWGVCSRLLNHHDAEDAFQATFLVLVRRAGTIQSKEMVGNWLYGVAHQTALQACRSASRRRRREIQVTEMPDTQVVPQAQWTDVQTLLDQELSRLPNLYRTVLVLSDLEGRTRREIARQLGVPEGTVAGRLARARGMLVKRLTQRGVVLSGGALAAMLSQHVVSAGMPKWVMSSTIKTASWFAVGPATTAGAFSHQVVALTEGGLKTMQGSKLQIATVFLLIVLAGIAGTMAFLPLAVGHPPTPSEKKDRGKELPAKQVKSDQEGIKGIWEIQVEETEKAVGVPLVEGMKSCKLTFKDGEIELVTKAGKQVGNYTLDEKANPKEFDMKYVIGAGILQEPIEEYRGTYVLDGDTLKIVWTRASEFPAKGLANLMVFKRKLEEKKIEKR
jgi:RNA polymerase sigma factor (sigma-70 family)